MAEGRDAAQLYGQFEAAFNSGIDDEQRRALLMRAVAGAVWSDGACSTRCAPTSSRPLGLLRT